MKKIMKKVQIRYITEVNDILLYNSDDNRLYNSNLVFMKVCKISE